LLFKEYILSCGLRGVFLEQGDCEKCLKLSIRLVQSFLTSLCLILDLVAVSYRKYGILTTIIALSGKDTKVKCLDFGELDQIVGVKELEKKHNWTGD